MEIIITRDYKEMSQRAALLVAAHIIVKPDIVLGLATGSTVIGFYGQLTQMQKTMQLDFSRVITFNLDEYCGLRPRHPQSYRTFMIDHFFSKVNIRKKNIHLLNGIASDPDKECQHYESQIKNAGGIDLQVLGIGRNGHIGFNEPADRFEPSTHITSLTHETRNANARFFDNHFSKVPKQALTIGMGTIMKAKEIILLASTKEKARALVKAVEGPVQPALPASILQLHPKTTLIIASEAARELDLAE